VVKRRPVPEEREALERAERWLENLFQRGDRASCETIEAERHRLDTCQSSSVRPKLAKEGRS
jgi:hypothetical protein